MPPAVFFAVAAAFSESKATPTDWAPAFEKPAEKRLFAQARLAVKLSRFQRGEAIALLESFLGTKPEAKVDQAWARRNLAMLLAVRGDTADRKKAMDLLMTDDESGETADDKRSTAAVLTALSRHLDNPQRKTVIDRSIKVLADLVNETRSPRDAFLLAQVYRASGNRNASQEVTQQAAGGRPEEPRLPGDGPGGSRRDRATSRPPSRSPSTCWPTTPASTGRSPRSPGTSARPAGRRRRWPWPRATPAPPTPPPATCPPSRRGPPSCSTSCRGYPPSAAPTPERRWSARRSSGTRTWRRPVPRR